MVEKSLLGKMSSSIWRNGFVDECCLESLVTRKNIVSNVDVGNGGHKYYYFSHVSFK